MFFNYSLIKKTDDMLKAQAKRDMNYINTNEFLCACGSKIRKCAKYSHYRGLNHRIMMNILNINGIANLE